MAFQKQFKTSYVSYNGWDYYLEIWVNATAGTITTSEIKLGTGGPIISYDTDNEDRFSPIISSNCVIPLVIESSVQENFVKQLREVYNERDVYVHLYKATEAQHSAVKPLWSGFVLMDLSSTPDEFYPYDFKITAIDGLGLLKDIDFVKLTTRRANEYLETDMYYGPGRYTFWLKEILLKTGASTTTEGASEDYVFTTAINWYESQMPTITQSLDPFYITKCSVGMFHTKTDNGVFEVTNCYEVLKELLKHWGARMTYWKGQFWIIQIPQYITPDSGTYINPNNIDTRTYDKTGSFISSSDNLGDSYYTRYQLNIGDLTGGIQKLTGTEVNYLPQIREARANNVSFGNGNRYGGFPREFTGNSAPDEIIFQDQVNDASVSDSFNLVIPLNVTVENGNPFYMKILFNFYCTDLTDTYYLQYNPTLTHKYYWVSSSQWITLVNAPVWDSGFTAPATGNSNQIQSHSNLEGFNQNILFKLYNTSTQAFSDLDLTGDFKFYLDIDAYGTNISNPGSFRFKLANAGLSTSQFFYPTHPSINVSWTNTLQSNYALQTPNIITNNAPNGNSIIQLTTPNIDPFEGMFIVITNTTGSIYGNSYVSSVSTSDVAIVDFGTLIWGDTLQISDLGCLQVYNGSTFVKSSSSGNWGNGILTGSLAFTQILLDEYLYGQTKVIESPSMRLVTSVLNRDSSDGSGLRPNFINPIGRLKESRTNLSDVQYVFKRGAFYTLTDEWDYEGFEIRRDVSSVITTVKEITGPNNPVTGVGSVPKTTTIPNSFGQIISKQIITSLSSSVAAGTITSLPIALINDVVFKVGDFFNVLNSDTNEFIKFELNAQQFSDSSALTVVSKTITDNIPANSIITFNAFDLTSQYQNKTRGTVAGFDITATGIEKSSINITDWLNSDTMTGAAVTNVPTALSVKNYVDGQVGASDTLAEVLANGNVTGGTNISVNDDDKITFGASADLQIYHDENNSFIEDNGNGSLIIRTDGAGIFLKHGADTMAQFIANGTVNLYYDNAKKFETTPSGISITGGGVFTGQVTIPATPVATTDAASKSYVDAQVGASDTLQEVTDNGNTTTNFIMIGSSSSPDQMLHISGLFPRIKLQDTDATNTADNSLIEQNNGVLRFRNDPNFLSNNSAIQFDIRGSEKMRLSTGGNLLIGTTTDSGEKLEVAGSIKAGNLKIQNANGGRIGFNRNTTNGAIYNNSYGAFQLQNNGTGFFEIQSYNSSGTYQSSFAIKENGNVGIGTSSPSEKLHVVGDALITGDSHADAFKPAATGEPIKFKNFGSTELARITDGGNLLLGTTSSSRKLCVQGTNNTALSIVSPNTNYVQLALGDTDDDNYAQILLDNNTNILQIQNGGGGIVSNRGITLDSSEKVGINTDSPSSIMHIVGGATTIPTLSTSHPLTISNTSNSGMSIISGNNSAGQVVFGDASDADVGRIRYQHSDNSFRFWTNADEKMSLTSGGNLGIGTSNPVAKIEIVGDGTLNSNIAFKQVGSQEHRIYAATNYQYNIIGSSEPTWLWGQQGVSTAKMTLNNTGLTLTGSLTGTNATFSGNVFSETYRSSRADGDVYIQSATATDFVAIGTQVSGQANLMRVLGNGNVLIGSTSDNGAKLQVTGIIRTSGGSVQAGQDYGFTLEDESNNNRYGLKFGAAGSVGGSNLLMLTNRSLSDATGGGEVAIGANSSTTGVTETEVVRIKAVTQSEVSIDGILSLTVQDTPADPSNNKSSIWLDSNWDLKIKITNSSGDTVTKTIVEYA